MKAKIDTGAVVSLFPMSLVSNMGLEVIGEDDLSMANGDLLHTYVSLCDVSLSEEDCFNVPIHVCRSNSDMALIGMDILGQCNYAQLHEWLNRQHSINFTLEIAQEPAGIATGGGKFVNFVNENNKDTLQAWS